MLFHESEGVVVLVLPSLPWSGEVVEISFLERRIGLRPFSALLFDVLQDTLYAAPIGVSNIPLALSEFQNVQVAHAKKG